MDDRFAVLQPHEDARACAARVEPEPSSRTAGSPSTSAGQATSRSGLRCLVPCASLNRSWPSTGGSTRTGVTPSGAAPGGEGGVVLRDQPAVAQRRDAGGRGDRRPVVEPQRPDVVHEDPHRAHCARGGASMHAAGHRLAGSEAHGEACARWACTARHLRPAAATRSRCGEKLTGETRDRVCAGPGRGRRGDRLRLRPQPAAPAARGDRRLDGGAVGDGDPAVGGTARRRPRSRSSWPGTTDDLCLSRRPVRRRAVHVGALRHPRRPTACSAELARVLKPGRDAALRRARAGPGAGGGALAAAGQPAQPDDRRLPAWTTTCAGCSPPRR